MKIPLLTANDIDCRIQSVKKNAKTGKVGAVLLIYKDARVDMNILDREFGPMNWQRTHEVINGNLFCSIDIWDDEKLCWVRKQDVGTESNTEKQKGEASDAFKRAGFNVGIGRELYTAPFIYIELKDDEYWEDDKKNVKASPSTKFSVKEIGYNDQREITTLVIMDKYGAVRYSLPVKKEKLPQDKPQATPPPKPAQQRPAPKPVPITAKRVQEFWDWAGVNNWTADEVKELCSAPVESLDVEQLKELCEKMQAKRKEAK